MSEGRVYAVCSVCGRDMRVPEGYSATAGGEFVCVDHAGETAVFEYATTNGSARVPCRDTTGSAVDVTIAPYDHRGESVWLLDVDDRRGRGRALLTDAERLALTGALCPSGYAAVDRGRLERLIEYVAADLACTAWPDEDGANPHWDRYLAARAALRPGDTESMPEPADTEGGGE